MRAARPLAVMLDRRAEPNFGAIVEWGVNTAWNIYLPGVLDATDHNLFSC